jgi:hypothetical protein
MKNPSPRITRSLWVAALILASCIFESRNGSRSAPDNSAIEGFIHDKSGRGVEGALVRIQDGTFAVTDAKGEFRLEGLSAGPHGLRVLHSDYLDTLIDVDTLHTFQTLRVDVRIIRRFATLAGRVERQNGKPLDRARVLAENQQEISVTDSDGAFALAKVEPGTVDLFFTRDGVGWGDTLLHIDPDGDYKNLMLRLKGAGGAVTFKAKDANGQPLSGAQIELFGETVGKTDSTGSGMVTNLPPGISSTIVIRTTDGSFSFATSGAVEGSEVDIGTVRLTPENSYGDVSLYPTHLILQHGQDTAWLRVTSTTSAGNGILYYYWNLDGKSAFPDSTRIGSMAVPVAALTNRSQVRGGFGGDSGSAGLAVVRIYAATAADRHSDTVALLVLFPDNQAPIVINGLQFLDSIHHVPYGYSWHDSLKILDPEGAPVSVRFEPADPRLEIRNGIINVTGEIGSPTSLRTTLIAVDSAGALSKLDIRFEFYPPVDPQHLIGLKTLVANAPFALAGVLEQNHLSSLDLDAGTSRSMTIKEGMLTADSAGTIEVPFLMRDTHGWIYHASILLEIMPSTDMAGFQNWAKQKSIPLDSVKYALIPEGIELKNGSVKDTLTITLSGKALELTHALANGGSANYYYSAVGSVGSLEDSLWQLDSMNVNVGGSKVSWSAPKNAPIYFILDPVSKIAATQRDLPEGAPAGLDSLIGASPFRLDVVSIQASSGPGGRLEPAGRKEILKGANIRFSILPDSGFALSSLTVNGVQEQLIDSLNFYEFKTVKSDQTLHAEFSALRPAIISVRFIADTLGLMVGGFAEGFAVEALPVTSRIALVFSVGNTDLAAVDAKGTVRGLKKGSTWLYVQAEDDSTKRDSLLLMIRPAPNTDTTGTKPDPVAVDSVVINPDALLLYTGAGPKTLATKVYPATLGQSVDWKSRDTAVATVDSLGNVGPVGVGSTVIIASSRVDGNRKDSVTVIVKKDSPLLSLSGAADTAIGIGMTVFFTPAVTQEYGSVTRFEWDLDGDGTWEGNSDTLTTVSFHYTVAGNYTARFRVRDSEGNETIATKVVRTVAPPQVIITSPIDKTVTSVLAIAVNWTVDGVPHSDLENLNDGNNRIIRKATDIYGNVGSDTVTVIADRNAPNPPTFIGPEAYTNNRKPTWAWASSSPDGAGIFRYQFDNGPLVENSSISFTPPDSLAEGPYTLSVQERDSVGNWSVFRIRRVVVDTTPPDSPMVQVNGPFTDAPPPAILPYSHYSNNPRPTWVWSSVGSGGIGSYRYKLWPETTFVETNTTSFTPSKDLPEGPYYLLVQERDLAGNWSLKGGAPVTLNITRPNPPAWIITDGTPTRTPTWKWVTGGNGGNGIFRYKLDSDDFSSGATTTTATTFTADKLPNGEHTFYVQESNAAGNWSLTSDMGYHITSSNYGTVYLTPGPLTKVSMSMFNDGLYIAAVNANVGGMLFKFNLLTTRTPEWQVTWPNQPGSEELTGVSAYPDGVYVSGSSASRTTDLVGDKELKGITAKFPLTGATGSGFNGSLWDTQTPAAPGAFSYGGNEWLHGIQVVAEGGNPFVYATGESQSGFSNPGRLYLTKVDKDGAVQWTSSDDPNNARSAGNAVTGMDGNIYVAGINSESGAQRVALEKFSSSGSKVWSKTGTQGNYAACISSSGAGISTGYVFAVGYAEGGAGGSKDFLIDKWDENGNLVWSRTYDRNSEEDILEGVMAYGGHLYAVGSTKGGTKGGKDAVFLDLDMGDGTLFETHLSGTSEDETFYSIAYDGWDFYAAGAQGNYLIIERNP